MLPSSRRVTSPIRTTISHRGPLIIRPPHPRVVVRGWNHNRRCRPRARCDPTRAPGDLSGSTSGRNAPARVPPQATRGSRRSASTPAASRADFGGLRPREPSGQDVSAATTRKIQRLYRYAVEHGDELQYIPCFCGCYRFGHKSTRDCYVKGFNADGTLTFTSHAAT